MPPFIDPTSVVITLIALAIAVILLGSVMVPSRPDPKPGQRYIDSHTGVPTHRAAIRQNPSYGVQHERAAPALGGTETAARLPYRVRHGLLSPAEVSFFGALKLAVQDRYTICPMVRLADLFFLADSNFGSFKKIIGKHADFVLCEPGSMRPVIGIELDDSSHQAARRVERDEFVNRVFQAAGLPLLRIPVRQGYNPPDLQAQILNAIENNAAASRVPRAPEIGAKPLCPQCDIPMKLRTARRGANAGGQFYGCVNYPDCHQIVQCPQVTAVGGDIPQR
ncbi:MAG TPA: DUF2726 domain-containing protein [Armatimonadota bacterium]|nr:DUF2726 domain-containing protein [Armatimonadota bacterium]